MYDREVNDLKVIKKTVQSLYEKLNFFVVAIEELKDLKEMIIEEIVDTLQAHEEKC